MSKVVFAVLGWLGAQVQSWKIVVEFLPLIGLTVGTWAIISPITGRILAWVAFGAALRFWYRDSGLPPDNHWWLFGLWIVTGIVFFFGWIAEEEREGNLKKWKKKLGHVKKPAHLNCLEATFAASADIKTAKKSVFTIKTQTGHGSGFFIARDGWALTNHHVVEDDEYFEVTLTKNGKPVVRSGKCVHSTENPDIALVKIDTDSDDRLRINFDLPKEGDEVFVIGTPLEADFLDGTVTKGVVSAIRETEEAGTLIQSDAVVHPGNSGGPLLDAHGNVIGVTVRKRDEGGINFFIPIKSALANIRVAKAND